MKQMQYEDKNNPKQKKNNNKNAGNLWKNNVVDEASVSSANSSAQHHSFGMSSRVSQLLGSERDARAHVSEVQVELGQAAG